MEVVLDFQYNLSEPLNIWKNEKKRKAYVLYQNFTIKPTFNLSGNFLF